MNKENDNDPNGNQKTGVGRDNNRKAERAEKQKRRMLIKNV